MRQYLTRDTDVEFLSLCLFVRLSVALCLKECSYRQTFFVTYILGSSF